MSSESYSTPTVQKGVWVSKKTGITTKDGLEVPKPSKDQVLIKNVVVGSNPKDWKYPRWNDWEGVEGNDVAGYIEQVGEDVTEFKPGDKVAAFTRMGTHTHYGAYQPYSLSPASTTFPLGFHPQKSSFEAAATLPLAAMTAAIGLFRKLGLEEPTSEANKGEEKKKAVVIYGAGSSVGFFAVQWAKKAGLFVIAVAGSSLSLPQRAGADLIIDYRTHSTPESLAAQIISSVPPECLPIQYCSDAITVGFSLNTCIALLSNPKNVAPSTSSDSEIEGGGKITTVLANPADTISPIPSNIIIDRTGVRTAYGGGTPEMGDDTEFARKWFRVLGKWLDEGKWLPMDYKIMNGGLDGVKEGLEMLENGEVKGVKLLYRIEDTPWLK